MSLVLVATDLSPPLPLRGGGGGGGGAWQHAVAIRDSEFALLINYRLQVGAVVTSMHAENLSWCWLSDRVIGIR